MYSYRSLLSPKLKTFLRLESFKKSRTKKRPLLLARSVDTTGFSEMWNDSCIDIDYFKEIFAQRCNDIFLQKWHTSMMNENSAPITAFSNKVYRLRTTWYSWMMMMMQNILLLSLELVCIIFQWQTTYFNLMMQRIQFNLPFVPEWRNWRRVPLPF